MVGSTGESHAQLDALCSAGRKVEAASGDESHGVTVWGGNKMMLARRVSGWHRESVKLCHVSGAVCWSKWVESLCMTTFALQHLLRETWRTAALRPPNPCNALTNPLDCEPPRARFPGVMTGLARGFRQTRLR